MLQRRKLPGRICLVFIGILIRLPSEAAAGQTRKRTKSSEKPSQNIVAGTVVEGDVDPRTLRAALEALPRRPERIVLVESEVSAPGQEKQLRELDGFVLAGSRVIYLRRQSPTLLAAEYKGDRTC